MSAIISFLPDSFVPMIYQKVYITEYKLKKEPEKNYAKLMAISRLKELLNLVDDRRDIRSLSTSMDMEKLLAQVKGEKLSPVERHLVVEIFTNEN